MYTYVSACSHVYGHTCARIPCTLTSLWIWGSRAAVLYSKPLTVSYISSLGERENIFVLCSHHSIISVTLFYSLLLLTEGINRLRIRIKSRELQEASKNPPPQYITDNSASQALKSINQSINHNHSFSTKI